MPSSKKRTHVQDAQQTLAHKATAAALAALKKGGDNLAMFQAVQAALGNADEALLAIDFAIMCCDTYDRLVFLQTFARGEPLHDFPDWPQFLARGGPQEAEPEDIAAVTNRSPANVFE